MPEPSPLCEREFLPSANQALADLEEATGKPVMVMEAPELGVLATIRRAGPEEASHLLRIKSGGNRLADYLIVFECRMALRDGPGPQHMLKARRPLREQVIRECERLQQQLPLAKARELGNCWLWALQSWASSRSVMARARRPLPSSQGWRLGSR